MRILVSGARGFIGRNLTENLKNIRDGKNRTRNVVIDEIMEYDKENTEAELRGFCRRADFVFHLAGVNRPENPSEFMEGNFGFSSLLLKTLKEEGNRCGVMLSSSVQASLAGRFAGSEYGASKLAGEELFFAYAEETGAKVYVYRFPNVFGKWCRPNYNSAVSTFCHNIAHDLPITVNDPKTELDLVYIDDVVNELIACLEGCETHCDYQGLYPLMDPQGRYCCVREVHHVTLGRIADLLHQFHELPCTKMMPAIPKGSFEQKLFSTYLSYLPKEKMVLSFQPAADARGSFTELLKSRECGQISVNVSNPGFTKGEHWHNSKWEIFFVVKGHALIQERKIGSEEVIEFEVDGSHPQGIIMCPGYTHNIINLGEEELITLMWANEVFDAAHPDTFSETVQKEA